MMRNSASVRVADLLRAKASSSAGRHPWSSDVAELKRSTNLLVARREIGDARGDANGHRTPLQRSDVRGKLLITRYVIEHWSCKRALARPTRIAGPRQVPCARP